MPTLIIPDGYAQVSIPHRYAGFARPAWITFGVNLEATESDYLDLANLITTRYRTAVGGGIDTSVTIGPTRMRIGQASGEPVNILGTTSGAGTSAGEKLPPNCNLYVQKRTLRGGRRGRGGFFIPWATSETGVSETGRLSPTDVGNFQTAMNAFWDAMSGPTEDPMGLVLLHTDGGDTVPGEPTPVVSLVVTDVVGSQRRRLDRNAGRL